MGFDPNEPEQRRRLRAAMKSADISISALWLKYFSLSGDAGEYEVEAYLQGLLSLPAIQRDLLALAANELIDDLPRPHAPYSDDFTGQSQGGSRPSQPDTGQPDDEDGRPWPEAERDGDGGGEQGTTTSGP